ncbi:MAG TPA: hypothetical protein VHO06_17655 [Polyangia bacterium]|nr:hypothetical protein [Polyangia bacterium]
MKDHVADQAGYLAALPKNDPERRLAEAHAQSCGPCREALEEGARLVSLLRRALPAARRESMPRSLPARPAPTAVAVARRLAWATTGGVALAWLFQLSVGGGFRLDLDCALVSLAVLAVAIACVTVLRGNERLAVATVVATSGLFAALSGSAAGLAAGVGIRCTFRELWAAGLTWLVVWAVGRRAGVTFDRPKTTAIVAAGALAAHAGQHLACAVPHSDAHLLVFHFGGVVLATALAALTTRRTPAPLALA